MRNLLIVLALFALLLFATGCSCCGICGGGDDACCGECGGDKACCGECGGESECCGTCGGEGEKEDGGDGAEE
jgi:hypothetical protein